MEFRIKLKLYSVWFIVNFIICLIPLLVALITDKNTGQIFSGFLSFSFTLLITSLYLFENYIYMKDVKILPDPLRWGSIAWVLLLMITFILYPEVQSFSLKNFFNQYLSAITIIFFLLTLLLTFLLNNPSIKSTVAKHIKEQKEQELKTLREDGIKMEEELKREVTK